jgi:phosphatidylserine decarboxylase
MSEFKPVMYRSFAEFFDREFCPGVRPFPTAPYRMGAFSGARYFARVFHPEQQFPIKGHSLNPEMILGSRDDAAAYAGGPVILARFAPMDYHHNHYPDEGSTLDSRWIGGSLWTVNRHALLNKEDILFRNHRQVNLLKARHFGRIAFVEIGAMSVGRIQQVHPLDSSFARGDEKSVFKFGGSGIVVFGEPGAWSPSPDLIENSSISPSSVRRCRR